MKYQPSNAISAGTQVGVDLEPLHTNVLLEMKKEEHNTIDT